MKSLPYVTRTEFEREIAFEKREPIIYPRRYFRKFGTGSYYRPEVCGYQYLDGKGGNVGRWMSDGFTGHDGHIRGNGHMES